ncbi:hypothetical protein [Tautonia rosea]|uniref:hypothetical protein n=1 Tax=Tautonia rosea TaxID=2728037 RepID=UPI0014761996|nr:hypothetical protein [Tautonia rosea]
MDVLRENGLITAASVTLACVLAGLCFAQGRQQKSSGGLQVVKDIIRAECAVEPTDPPSLSVTVTAIDPRALPQHPRIIPGKYESPPDDGIQDFFVVAVPAEGGQPTETEFTVKDTWNRFRDEAPWLRGIRIHGAEGAITLLVQ